MNGREKLIALLDDGCYKACSDASGKKVNEVLADYLLANGVIVPPVKIGDTVYVVVNPFNTKPYFMPYFITSTVCAVHIADGSRNSRNHKRESYFLAECPNTKYVKKYPLSKIDKTVFLTCEEAEKAISKETAQNGLAYATPNFELLEG